ncbi:DUF2243 domain-containing protein [Rubrivirga sp.]|uniref:DUF2243 domain-containing protein n=1 Tax=Rubrivirga sp. TaxID=1885344 RepID=UPI003B52B1D0
MRTEPHPMIEPRRSLWAAALVGAGVMAAVDEVVFHQLLRWHRFYDLSTPAVGVVSDGLLHAASLLALIGGFFLLADLLRRGAYGRGHARAGFFVGAGGFQLFDGLVDHKVLRVHQVRYVEDLLPYDVAWNLAGVALLVVGAVLWRRARAERAGASARSSGP